MAVKIRLSWLHEALNTIIGDTVLFLDKFQEKSQSLPYFTYILKKLQTINSVRTVSSSGLSNIKTFALP